MRWLIPTFSAPWRITRYVCTVRYRYSTEICVRNLLEVDGSAVGLHRWLLTVPV